MSSATTDSSTSALAESRSWLLGDGSARTLDRSLRALVGVVLTLSGIGLVAAASFAPPGEELLAARRHALYLAVGLLGFLLAIRIDLERWIHQRDRFVVGIAILLGCVFFFPDINEAHRWIRFGSFSFQPSELAKLVMIYYTAAFVAEHGAWLNDFRRGFLSPLLRIGAISGLILFEPDFGTATFLFLVCSTMLVVAGARWSHFAAVGLFTLPLMLVVAWTQFEHVSTRIAMLFQETEEVLQISRGHLALAAGGLGGEGVGRGVMKLGLVPEGRNDFVFAQIGEEWGLAGTAGVILLFGLFAVHGIRILNAVRDPLRSLVIFGCIFSIAFQAVLNLGVVTKLLPPKGIALPFVSAGGSSLVAGLIALGLIVGAARSALVRAREASGWETP
ncbi:MAG: FtsW/RodA/SpoVE family cell cycle protein [Planctomycetes bacterium]|nr:FtsW/RodA/SpoVE family cell cycle protein [Planctomycetota bacterium]